MFSESEIEVLKVLRPRIEKILSIDLEDERIVNTLEKLVDIAEEHYKRVMK